MQTALELELRFGDNALAVRFILRDGKVLIDTINHQLQVPAGIFDDQMQRFLNAVAAVSEE